MPKTKTGNLLSPHKLMVLSSYRSLQK